jgi:hypothetical protein
MPISMRAQHQHAERQADVVVEVARRRVHLRRAPVRARAGGDHFLDRGLAVGARHRDQRHAELATPVGGEPPERGRGVVDRHQRQPGRRGCGGALDQRRHGAAARGLVQEMVAVEALAAQRDEQVAAARAAAVAAHGLERDVGAAQLAAGRRRRFGKPHHGARSRSSRRASAASLNGRRRPPASW